jgi:hypothetical protein
MRWFFRPSVLIVVSVALVGAAAVVFRTSSARTRPQPLPVAANENEIVWLYPATNTTTWERFVAAVRRGRDRLQKEFPGLEIEDGPSTFPRETAAIPQVALRYPGSGRRLVYRWYKVTRDWTAGDWIAALLRRDPPPLAVIGGGTSNWGRELAARLRTGGADLPERSQPLLLLTTATADKVLIPEKPAEGPDPFADLRAPEPGEDPDKPMRRMYLLYPGRTFRFCFTNRQMATAMTRFIWMRKDLRPDGDPACMVQWDDDSYSRDLIDGYYKALSRRVEETALQEALPEAWAWLAGCAARGGFPPALVGGAFPAALAQQGMAGFRLKTPNHQLIDSSVGSFANPNPFEAQVARQLLERLQPVGGRQGLGPPQELLPRSGDSGAANGGAAAGTKAPARPLLVVTGQAQPSRRLLRELARSAPDTARAFVVTAGDAIPFNTVYRDRLATWPIQDLPFRLVFFCHHNPVDRSAGFRPQPARLGEAGRRPPPPTSATGTEDLLLFADINEALVLACEKGGKPCRDPETLKQRLLELRWHISRIGYGPSGIHLFGKTGQRASGTGEHVVYLQPLIQGDRVLPRATIEVHVWKASTGHGRVWQSRLAKPLEVSYDEAPE